jgi:hypothetical protein
MCVAAEFLEDDEFYAPFQEEGCDRMAEVVAADAAATGRAQEFGDCAGSGRSTLGGGGPAAYHVGAGGLPFTLLLSLVMFSDWTRRAGTRHAIW